MLLTYCLAKLGKTYDNAWHVYISVSEAPFSVITATLNLDKQAEIINKHNT